MVQCRHVAGPVPATVALRSLPARSSPSRWACGGPPRGAARRSSIAVTVAVASTEFRSSANDALAGFSLSRQASVIVFCSPTKLLSWFVDSFLCGQACRYAADLTSTESSCDVCSSHASRSARARPSTHSKARPTMYSARTPRVVLRSLGSNRPDARIPKGQLQCFCLGVGTVRRRHLAPRQALQDFFPSGVCVCSRRNTECAPILEFSSTFGEDSRLEYLRIVVTVVSPNSSPRTPIAGSRGPETRQPSAAPVTMSTRHKPLDPWE